MKDSQYDRIAERYLEVNRGPINLCAVVPTFLDMIGDVAGLDVLDAACGSGFFSRLLKSKGAARVVGVDISSRQLSLARTQPGSEGIEYRSVGALKVDGAFGPEFDLATGVFLLNYAESEEDLKATARSLCNVLKPGGRFAAVTQNPRFRFFEGVRYRRRFRRLREGDLLDGEKFFLEIHGERGKICEFYCYHWSQDMYEAAFAAAGFGDLRWVPVRVDPAGRAKYGEKFWDAFEENPHLIGLTAQKA